MQRDQVIWRDGNIPQSIYFDDPYYSLDDGLAETIHVFLNGNDLPERFRDGISIAELGFGCGLNALATLQAWEKHGLKGRFRFTSFERFPMETDDMIRALARWPLLCGGDLTQAWSKGARKIAIGSMDLEIVEGDARVTLPQWEGNADAWYLDGFSPAKNPEMWEHELLLEVGRHTRPSGTCATYSASRAVRDGLSLAGFNVLRCNGFGRKRHMTRASLIQASGTPVLQS